MRKRVKQFRPQHVLRSQIYEYRMLRTVMNALGGVDLLTPEMLKRVEYIGQITWPLRNERLKKYNDSLMSVEFR